MRNPWEDISAEEARAMDRRKEAGLEAFRCRLKRQLQWRLIEPHLPPDRKCPILDLGGGTGYWSIRLARLGYPVVLADISPGMLEEAARNIAQAALTERVALRRMDMLDLSELPEAAFPLVLALGAPLSYCGDVPRALRQIARVCPPAGVLVGDGENRYTGALFPRRARCWADARRLLLEGLARWPDPDNPAPIHMFCPAELRALLLDSGWQVHAMYPSDLLSSLVHDDILREPAGDEKLFAEALELELRLREDPSLLCAGRDVQFVARHMPGPGAQRR